MTEKTNIGSYHLCFAAFLILIALSGPSQAKTNIDTTKTVDLNKYMEIPLSEVAAGDVVNVDIQVTSGGPVDILLMKTSDYSGYLNAIKERGTVNYIADGSLLGITSRKYSYRFPEGGNYHLVIDNSDVPKGGGSPLDQVEVNIKVTVETPPPPPKTSGFEAILAALVIIGLRKK